MVSEKNDFLIEQLLEDKRYNVLEDGTVLTTQTGAKGSIKGQWRECAVTLNDGYKYIAYKYKKLALHRILYAKFIGKLDSAKFVNHKDLNRSNNTLSNLELITISANTKHAYTFHKPVISNYKLSPELAEKIKLEYAKGGVSQKELGKKYNVSKGTIHSIVNNKTWNKGLSLAQNINKQAFPKNPMAQPKWVNIKELSDIYDNCPKGFVVDHIIPTTHEFVCGLHAPINLQYLSKEENEKKSNKFDFTMTNDSWK